MAEQQTEHHDQLGGQLWQQHGEQYRARLAALIAHRPITEREETKAAREAVAAWYRAEIAAAFGQPEQQVQVWETPTGPYLFADRGRPGPTIGFYWHVDVQPVGEGQEALWELAGPEARPESHDQPAFWGRGSCDDLGLGLAAWTGMKAALPHCPYNIQLLISTGEESGDKPLAGVIEANRHRFAAEAWFIPDSGLQDGYPAISLSLRGLARFHLEVRGPAAPMHSGIVGGACPDPTVAAFQILGSLVDANQRIVVPEIANVPYDAQLERDFVDASPDRGAFLRDAGVTETVGGPQALGLTLWRRPSLTIHAVETGVPPYLNAVASLCRVYFSIRLVPGQDPRAVEAALQRWIEARRVPGVQVTLASRPGDLSEGTRVPLVEPWVSRLRAAMEASYGLPVVFNGSGGSEPVVALANRLLGRPAYMMGLGGHGEHGPHEHMLLTEARGAMATVARLLGHPEA
jgi:acetylornithine deacetylase/succinyl-diaminopimelate desuccinylase-like protein